jgi:DEAD/DEAH box helicase domain-containing protein
VGFGGVDLPEHKLHTDAFWVVPPGEVLERVRQYGRIPEDGLLGIANAAVGVLPLWVMCDPQDVGATVNSANTPSPAIFVFDRYPGGIGYAQKAHELVEQVFESALFLIEECPCDEGCPSCVGSPLPPFGQQDSDMDSRGKIPDKEAAICILRDLLQREPYTPKPLDPAKLARRMAAAMAVTASPEPADAPAPDVERPPVKRLPENVEKKIRRRIQQLRGRPT